ncbi:PLIN2 protein, partial [Columbina picui]|nr:PLIN2 protein [Columbina picui]
HTLNPSALTPFSPPQSIGTRVASLPLVSSAYGMVSTAYASTKESHPYVKSVCDAAEKGVKTLTAAAVSGAQPILTKLEPQISTANEYACKGLDKLEEKLPILQQPPEQVTSPLGDTVWGSRPARGAGTKRPCAVPSQVVAGTRELVSSTVSGAVGLARGGVERTRSALSTGVSTVVGSRVGRLLATGVDVVEQLKQGMDQKLQGGQEKLQQMWLEWSKKQPGGDKVPPEPVESGTLAMLQGLTQQLQSSCQPLVSSLQGLPASIQDMAGQVRNNVEELRAALASASSLQDVTGSVLAQARARATKARQLMDELVEHVAHNTPLTWLVGPFTPSGQCLVDLEMK